MDFDQEQIDRLQTSIFQEKLMNVEASQLEEAMRCMARNTEAARKTADPPEACDGTDKQADKTGSFRRSDFA